MYSSLSLTRALGAIGGSAGVALTSLVLALCLMQNVSADAYGLFAFLLVTQALANGLSNALLGSPLLIALSDFEASSNEGSVSRIHSFMLANFILCFLFSLIQALTVYLFSSSFLLCFIYACGAFLNTLRWFGRSYCNNTHEHARVVVSDSIYSLFILVVALVLFLTDNVSMESFGVLTFASALLSIPFLGRRYLKQQFVLAFRANFAGFFDGWERQGKHALLGVLSTEATLNSHSYMVTFFFGPSAFAPIAAAGLLFRPVMVVLTSLSQVERPRLRHLLSSGLIYEAKTSLVRYRLINVSFWLLNCFAAFIVLVYFVDIYWRDASSVDSLILSACFFALIRGSRCFSSTYSVFLQSADQFKALSLITVKTSLLTVPLVFICLNFFGSEASLIGVLVGEFVSLTLMSRLYRCFN